MDQFGKLLLGVGLLIALIGGLIWGVSSLFPQKLGQMPGDITIKRDGFTFYFPIMTMLIVSGILTLIFWLIGWIRK